MSSMQGDGSVALALIQALAAVGARHDHVGRDSTGRCARPWSGRTGPRAASPRRPQCAAGRCRPTRRCAPLCAMPKRSTIVVGGASDGGAVRRRDHRRRPTPLLSGPHSTSDGQPNRSRIPAATRAEALGRPALVRPRRAGVDERERAAAEARSRRPPPPRVRGTLERKRGRAGLEAQRRHEREVLVHDVRGRTVSGASE